MAENREVILADFQACTGIDDVGEALLYLEDTNWDLLAAVNQAMPRDTQQLPSEQSPDVEMIEEIKHAPIISASPAPEITCVSNKMDTASMDSIENAKPSTSKLQNCSTHKKLTFHFQCPNQIFKVELPEQCTITDLQQIVWEKSLIPPCQQRIIGWKKEPQSNSTVLKSLDLPKENNLHVSVLPEVTTLSSEPADLAERMTRTYVLNVKDEVHNKSYQLNYLGSSTILAVKSGVHDLTDVPVRNQLWKGWPSSVTDDQIMLAQSGINYPIHNLTVSKLPAKEDKKDVIQVVDSDSSIEEQDEFEDVPEAFNVDDDIFIDNVRSTKMQRLMPENVEDEIVGTIHFSEQYEKRYGPIHPEFFTGTFEDAVKESCLKPAKERKLLAVYLHHDSSILANVFCTQLLGFETVLQLLSNDFIVWGWDITHESNKQRFISSVNQTLGQVASMTVRAIDVDRFPALMIIMRSRSSTEVYDIVYGNIGVNELLTNLIQAVDAFQERRRADIDFEEERQARERVKQEQDRAYQESLAADRAKEEAKQMQEEMEKRKKKEAESERLAEEARKEAYRQAVESNLPPEPEQENGDGVMKIRVRLPAGKFLERRFQSDTPLQTLLNFLIVEGYPTEEYKVLSSWPRRDLTSMDSKLTLMQLKFCPQETVILEER
ncbi:FAS-associated factor 1 [Prorops nasuta]|uniref:FAS-associated factor 1 n=1 Tax=Prorops nasuta TaxID=863751 RepID=UPI0034CD28ED